MAGTVAGHGRVCLNARYLIDALEALDTENVVLSQASGGEGVLITCDELGTRLVIMPMNWPAAMNHQLALAVAPERKRAPR
jgi:DNA polymerase III sliding clamp (beta) subunit (PCNA family)